MTVLSYSKDGLPQTYSEPSILGDIEANDELHDEMQAAYKAEHDRWGWRAREKTRGSPYELVRNSSPNNDIISDDYTEVITFTRRECQNIAQVENWLETYRSRAAMKAALEVYGGPGA